MGFLSGYKTYIFAAMVAGASTLRYLGYITEDMYLYILGIAGAGGMASLRSGVKKELSQP